MGAPYGQDATLVAAGVPGYITGYIWVEIRVSAISQKRALRNYRKRLNQRGLARFEVLGLDADRDLIRSLAKRLTGDGPDASQIRASLRRTIAGEPSRTGGILAALRRSPLVGAELDTSRATTDGRQIEL